MADRAQALSGTGEPPGVPDGLHVSATEKLKLHAHAIGVQIYTCSLGTTGYAFAAKAPEADLFDESGKYIGNHFLGPTWQHKDGSKVVGTVVARVNAPTADAVPWLLLSGRNTGLLPGKLSQVSSIQRLFTNGGVAPTVGCDAAHVGAEARIDYTAEYYFYQQRNSRDDD